MGYLRPVPEQTGPGAPPPERPEPRPEPTPAARPEQATVSRSLPDGSAEVLRDDGVLVPVPSPAVGAGGWRALRPGQRVTLRRDAAGRVVALLRPV
ncbi:hypothetical protein CNX65_29510 [Actinosynnema pretiosum]|uniref:Uncharacterized protein n=1 Tax=Actinosynnema pretiosum TaxID=42197 RepID=A0A290ZD45_9PSEU|nr:hypothetical protein CNX65_29510 [Actinosynnema pretiosum]